MNKVGSMGKLYNGIVIYKDLDDCNLGIETFSAAVLSGIRPPFDLILSFQSGVFILIWNLTSVLSTYQCVMV